MRRPVLKEIVTLLALVMAVPASAAEPEPRFVAGGGGLPIAMKEWGNPAGPAIVLIHGAGFAKEYWAPQERDAALTARFHFVSFDLRGHGASAKPWREEDLSDPALWADDLAAVIAAAKLTRPTIVAWSMGGYVAVDYVRKYGSGSIAGLMLVSSTGGLIPTRKVARTDPAYAQANAGLMSADLGRFAAGAAALVPFMSGQAPSPETRADWARQQAALPVTTRRAMRGFRIDNADQVAAMTLPLAFVIGGKDAAMPAEELDRFAAGLPHAQVIRFADAGHTLSSDAPAAFDRAVERFVGAVQIRPVQARPAKP